MSTVKILLCNIIFPLIFKQETRYVKRLSFKKFPLFKNHEDAYFL